MRERFAAALTHDMRTPLGVAVSALELSLRTLDADRARAMTTKALEHLQRVDLMICELLHSMAFAGGRTMQLAHSCFDVQELLTEVQADAMAVHGSRLKVEGPSVRGWWGRPELKRAIENMVGNAFKYGDPQGPVKLVVNEAYGRLLLSVHNEGGSIPVEEQAGIFQMYRRAGNAARERVPGWGIGLPYLRSVTESHGGSVGVDSSPERGTTFCIDIPIDARPGSVAAA